MAADIACASDDEHVHDRGSWCQSLRELTIPPVVPTRIQPVSGEIFVLKRPQA
jgi:hypothetical protein